MVVSFGAFGTKDVSIYREYLLATCLEYGRIRGGVSGYLRGRDLHSLEWVSGESFGEIRSVSGGSGGGSDSGSGQQCRVGSTLVVDQFEVLCCEEKHDSDKAVGCGTVLCDRAQGGVGSGSGLGRGVSSVRGFTSVVGGVSGEGGPNLERNRENRRLKRERKLKRQSMNQDWRKRDKSTADSGVSVGGNQGFWNSCSPEVRQQLIDSKAEWHIAENKRRAREEVAKLEKSTSVQAVVKQVLDTVKLANELKKNTKDEKIGGWAETVADSLNKSVAESVPSSLPSLESVGYGEAAIGRGGLSTPQTSNSEYDEVCQKLADKESICEKLNLRISELETKQLVSDGEMKRLTESEKNVEKRLFEAEIDKIKLRHYSSDIFCDDFLQRDIDMFTRDYKKKQQQKKKNKGS